MDNICNFQECFKTPICDAYRDSKKMCSICQEIINKRISVGRDKQREQTQ